MKTTSLSISNLIAAGLEETPLVTDDVLTFVYEGKAADVEVVVMEDRFSRVDSMSQVPDQDIWFADVPLDADGSIEYRLAVLSDESRRLILDPRNPKRSSGPLGVNSVASGPRYVPPPWLGAASESGSLQSLGARSKLWGRYKTHLLYIPPGFDRVVRYPLLIVHDGPEFAEFAGLKECLDVLISSGDLPPMLALLHAPHDRNQEYVDNPTHIRHLVEEVLPRVYSTYQIGPVFAMGASLGAVASLSVAYRRPGTIDGLLLQSGSFVTALGGRFKRGPILRPVTRFVPEILSDSESLPGQIVMSCGTYDGLVEDHRRLVPQLRDRIPGVRYEEINAGHHWRCWRDRLRPDLMALLRPA